MSSAEAVICATNRNKIVFRRQRKAHDSGSSSFGVVMAVEGMMICPAESRWLTTTIPLRAP